MPNIFEDLLETIFIMEKANNEFFSTRQLDEFGKKINNPKASGEKVGIVPVCYQKAWYLFVYWEKRVLIYPDILASFKKFFWEAVLSELGLAENTPLEIGKDWVIYCTEARYPVLEGEGALLSSVN
jgi:hypothetical protein